MKAVYYDKFGGIEVLKFGEVPSVTVGPGQIKVKVVATTVNVIDSRVRSGMMGILVNKKFPKIPGSDFSGKIIEVGSGVLGFKKGDDVFGALDPFVGGAFADEIVIDESHVIKKPEQVSFTDAASISITSLAALISIRDLAKVKKSTSVLIHGASGALGLAALQIAKFYEAKVIVVVGTNAISLVNELGADAVIDYKKQDGTQFQQNFDVIINCSGKFPYSLGCNFLNKNGRHIEPSPTIPVFIGSKIANLFRSQKHLVLQTTVARKDLAVLLELILSGKLKPIIANIIDRTNYEKAFELMEKGGVIGKVVMTHSPFK